MKIKYLKREQSFGEYQARRIVWIHTLKGELLLKSEIIDKAGNLLYRITELPESDYYEISDNVLTLEEMKDIAELLRQSDLDKNWQEEIDFDDEEDLAFVLGSFGEDVATRDSLIRKSRKTDEVIVEYIFDSSKGIGDEEVFETVHFKPEVTEDLLIEDYLLPMLLEREELDAIRVKIARAGVVNCYLVTILEDE